MSVQLVKPPPDIEPDGDPVITKEDVRRINQRLAREIARHKGQVIREGFFRCPWPCTKSQYEKVRNPAIDKWIYLMAKQGWTLKSKVTVNANRRRPSTRYSGDWVISGDPDEVEIPVQAWFLQDKIKARKIEVPVGPA